MCWFAFLILIFCLIPDTTLLAQSRQPTGYSSSYLSLAGRHSVIFRAGFLSVSNLNASESRSASSAQTSGFIGSISHKYWLSEQWAVGPHISLADARTGASEQTGLEISTSSLITSILFGVTYSFAPDDPYSMFRFHLSAFLGPYMSTATSSINGSTASEEKISVSAFGILPAAGFDWYLNRKLLFNFTLAYHIVSDFEESVGSTDNYSGLEFSMGLGIVFGHLPY